jgi:hypothetical protein
MDLADKIKETLLENGAADVGFAAVPDAPAGLPYAVSIVVALSDAVVDEITDAPQYTYFYHYRTVNSLIDQLLLKTGILLQREGTDICRSPPPNRFITVRSGSIWAGIPIKKPPFFQARDDRKERAFPAPQAGPAGASGHSFHRLSPADYKSYSNGKYLYGLRSLRGACPPMPSVGPCGSRASAAAGWLMPPAATLTCGSIL